MSESVPKGPNLPHGYAFDQEEHYVRLFTRFLQLVFASFKKGSYHWSEDEKFSEIFISDQCPIDAVTIGQRPAIILALGPVQYGNLSLDQQAGPIVNYATVNTSAPKFYPSVNRKTGERKHTDLNSAVMTYNCLASVGPEARHIGYLAAMATRRLKRTIMAAGVHRVGEELQIGSEGPPGSIITGDPKGIVAVTVSVPFWYQDFWSVAPVNPVLLKEIQLNLSSQVNAPGPDAEVEVLPDQNGRTRYTVLQTLSQSTKVFKFVNPRSRNDATKK